MKRAAIYCRVSTDKQRDNYSIPSQLAECVKYANKMGYSIVGNRFVDPETGRDCTPGNGAIPAFVDDYSSLELYRPGLDAAYDYLEKQGFDVVIVYSIDRLDRDPYKLRVHEYGFYKHKAIVEYVKGEYTDSPEGQFLKNVIASAAQLENEWRTERFNRGKRQKAMRNETFWNWLPLGYEVDNNNSKDIKINENQADIVKRIFNYYVVEKLSIRAIVKRLNEDKNAIPARGRIWAKSSIAKILKNTAYIGYIHYNKSKRLGKDFQKKRIVRDQQEWIRINIPPIIDEKLFEAARERLSYNSKVTRRPTKHEYLLSGMIFCEECGKAFISQCRKPNPKRRTKNEQLIYRHRAKEGHCSNHSISARILDNQVWNKIIEFLLTPEIVLEGYKQAIEKGKLENQRELELLDELNKTHSKLEQRLKNLLRAYTDPDIGISKEDYLGQKTQIEQEKSTIQKRIYDIKSFISDIPTPDDLQNLEAFSMEIKERLQSENWQPTMENKRWILNRLNIKVLLNPDGNIKISGIISDAPILLDTPY